MTPELARILERTRQIRASRTRTRGEAVAAGPEKSPAQNGTLTAGARVVDTVTGEEGIVVHATRENIIIQPA